MIQTISVTIKQMKSERIAPNAVILTLNNSSILINAPNNAMQELLSRNVQPFTIIITELTIANLSGLTMFLCQVIVLQHATISIFAPVGFSAFLHGFQPLIRVATFESIKIIEVGSSFEVGEIRFIVGKNEVTALTPSV